MGVIENFEALLAKGQDSALLRFGLGSAYLKEGDADKAATHLRRAVEQDPNYSAAWKLYGKALTAAGKIPEARSAYEAGIHAAEARRDMQAAKEMKVFLKRLQKLASNPESGN
jgi:predicted Zn-dependent protease